MKHSILFKTMDLSPSDSVSRQRVIKAQFITPIDAAIQVKVGKHAISINKDESFWLPHDCLHSISTKNQTRLYTVEFSAIHTEQLPFQFSHLPADAFYSALLHELASNKELQSQSYFNLLQVCLDHLHKVMNK